METAYTGEKSEVNMFQGLDAGNIEKDATNNAAGLTESDSHQKELEKKVTRPQADDKNLTWLVAGKIAFYKKRPLSKPAKTVFYGKQRVLRDYWREIAIKVIQSEEKNLNELRLLMKLHHPNIVEIYDAGEFSGGLTDIIYFVMELCSQSLRTYIEENNFDFKKSFSFIRQIIEGLIYLHENNVTHRDLKPDNVLISLCEKFAKLSDFGLSKEISKGRSVATVTTIGAGTEGYRAPETYKNISHVSPSIDVFPFGLVTHFTFTKGKHPFGPNQYEWQVNIMKNQNLDLTQIPKFKTPHAHKREQLIEMLNQTLQSNPSDRPTMMDIKRSAFIADGPKDDILQGLETFKLAESKEDLKKTAVEKNKERDSSNINVTQMKRIQEIQDELKKPLIEIGFLKSARILSELRELKGSDDLNILLQMAECELQLARGKEEESIQRTKCFISSSGLYSARDVHGMAYELKESKCYVKALILYRISNDLHKSRVISLDTAVKLIAGRVVDVSYATNPLIEIGGRSRDIAIKYGLEFMERLMNDLRAIKKSTPDVKALKEASCLNEIAFTCHVAFEYEKSIRFGSEGVEILEKRFGPNASKHKIYGRLLNNLGFAHRNSGNYLEAEHYYVRAIEAYEKSSGHENDNDKLECIEEMKRNLAETRAFLHKQK